MPMVALKMTTPTVKEALRSAVLQLQQAKLESASLDARILLEHVMHMSREQVLIALEETMNVQHYTEYQAVIARRAGNQPVSQLIGKREFWGREFRVTPDTLDPRPDSETLIEATLARILDKKSPLKLLDLGTGTGCLLLTLLKELPLATGTGVDFSPAALAVAKENTLRLGLQARTTFLTSHWCDEVEGTFDIIVANPPYIPSKTVDTLSPEVARFEPRLALDGGEDGLNPYRAIIPELPSLLTPHGFAVFEIGMGQEEGIREIVAACRLQVAEVRQDLGGISRCVIVTL